MSLIPKNLPPFPPIPSGLSPELETYFREVGIYSEVAARTHDVNLGPDGIDPGHIHRWSQAYMFHAETHGVGGTDLISHDDLTDFVASKHINHAGVSIIAGTNLNGGGTIAANRTLNLDASPTLTSITIGANTLDTNEWAVLDGVTANMVLDWTNETNDFLTTGTLGAGAITGTSFIIGGNTLDTNEWAFLDGQDQNVKTTSSPIFENLEVSNDIVSGGSMRGTSLITGGNIGPNTHLDLLQLALDNLTVDGAITSGNIGVTGTVGVTGTITATSHIKTDGNVQLKDPGAAFYLKIATSFMTLSADRNLNIDVGDATRTLTLSGNPILGGQDYQTTGSPTFAALTAIGVITGSSFVGLGDVLDDLNALGAPASDGQFIVATGAGAFAYESTTVARTSLGVGEADSPTFAGAIITGNFTVDTSSLFVNSTNNRVGFGILTPIAGVEIKTGSADFFGAAYPSLLLRTGTTDGTDAYLGFLAAGGASSPAIVFDEDHPLRIGKAGGADNPDDAFAEYIKILTNGNVGINDPAPASKLDVTGDINTTENYKVDDVQVVSNQGAAVADATDADDVILRLNDLLARVRTHGLIAT